MWRILVSAVLLIAVYGPAGADPLQISPQTYTAVDRADARAATTGGVDNGQRYADAGQSNLGGGFIQFLFGGAARQPAVARPYQPAPAEYQTQSIGPAAYQVQSVAPAVAPSVPVATRDEPTQTYALPLPSDKAHPPSDPKFDRQLVDYTGGEKAGTIIIDTPNRFLFLVEQDGKALRYGIGVGRPGFTWAGVKTVSAMREWPDWFPPQEMIQRRPDLPRYMAGGPENPLGARALYLGSTLYRIHGSNEPWTIGQQVSSGCIRMRNDDVSDLYGRVKVGTKVVVM